MCYADMRHFKIVYNQKLQSVFFPPTSLSIEEAISVLLDVINARNRKIVKKDFALLLTSFLGYVKHNIALQPSARQQCLCIVTAAHL